MKLFGWKSAGREDLRPVLSRVGASRVIGDWPVSYEAQVREGYLGNALAQRAVRVVADGIGEAPLSVSSPELERLVRARSGGQALLATVAAQLLLHGNAYVQLLTDAEGGLRELFALRPERVTVRIAGCVIWSTDLIESRSSGSSGKGQPSVTNYAYSASFAVALSGRPIAGVGRIWADGNLLRGAAGDFKVSTGFRLYLGDEAQTVDPLIAAAEDGLAPAHRGIAYAVFEHLQLADYGNRIPSLTFEVIGDAAPVPVGTIAAAVSGGLVEGAIGLSLPGFAAYGDARSVLELLGAASGSWFVADGRAIELRDGLAAGATLDDAGCGAGEKPGLRGVRSLDAIERVAQRVTVAHYDPAREYQTGL